MSIGNISKFDFMKVYQDIFVKSNLLIFPVLVKTQSKLQNTSTSRLSNRIRFVTINLVLLMLLEMCVSTQRVQEPRRLCTQLKTAPSVLLAKNNAFVLFLKLRNLITDCLRIATCSTL